MDKKTFKQAGYSYAMYIPAQKLHTLYNIETGNFEGWISNKNHASYGLKYKNTELEFCFSFTDKKRLQLINQMKAIHNFGEQNHGFHSRLLKIYRKYIA